MPLGPGRYRVKTTKTGQEVRLHFGRGGRVDEAKNLKTGATHTPAEFRADRDAAVTRKVAGGLASLLMLFVLTGCTSTGAIAPDIGARLLADAQCLQALTDAGIAVIGAADPATTRTAALSTTSLRVLATLQTAQTVEKLTPAVLTACAKSIEYGVQDAQGIAARMRGALTR